MITGKVVANAGSHRILVALAEKPCEPKELKNVVGAVNSVARFNGEYMGRLEAAGYVEWFDGHWHITDDGQRKLLDLGPLRTNSKPSVATSRTTVGVGLYDPKINEPKWMRPGSEEFLKWPSRMGNRLYYRDGRVETIGEE